MNLAIMVEQYGGPEVMEAREIEIPEPRPGEVLVRHTVLGVNMIDTYYRKGLYQSELPMTPGHEAAAIVVKAGPGTTGLKPGDRVAYAGPEPGAYCQFRVLPAAQLIPIPDTISDDQVGATLTRGITAEVLLTRVHQVVPGETIVIYAAAGGAGTIMTQWAVSIGAIVIGVVGSSVKAQLALDNGCAHVLVRDSDDIVARVREITQGVGVPVVYDSLGKDTFTQSLDCLSPQGLMVSFGNATGPVEAFNILELAQKGSLFLTRPSAYNWLAEPGRMLQATGSFFEKLESGAIRAEASSRFPLEEAPDAHRSLESGQTTGAMILVP
jgi:NADPH2:quinone reductase